MASEARVSGQPPQTIFEQIAERWDESPRVQAAWRRVAPYGWHGALSLVAWVATRRLTGRVTAGAISGTATLGMLAILEHLLVDEDLAAAMAANGRENQESHDQFRESDAALVALLSRNGRSVGPKVADDGLCLYHACVEDGDGRRLHQEVLAHIRKHPGDVANFLTEEDFDGMMPDHNVLEEFLQRMGNPINGTGTWRFADQRFAPAIAQVLGRRLRIYSTRGEVPDSIDSPAIRSVYEPEGKPRGSDIEVLLMQSQRHYWPLIGTPT